jgi:Williams-Beuren syndrome DDT (WSD), D-TOX E motif
MQMHSGYPRRQLLHPRPFMKCLIVLDNVLQIRLEPLGLDRRHNRYWLLLGGAETAADPAPGRLFFESAADGSFRCVGLT